MFRPGRRTPRLFNMLIWQPQLAARRCRHPCHSPDTAHANVVLDATATDASPPPPPSRRRRRRRCGSVPVDAVFTRSIIIYRRWTACGLRNDRSTRRGRFSVTAAGAVATSGPQECQPPGGMRGSRSGGEPRQRPDSVTVTAANSRLPGGRWSGQQPRRKDGRGSRASLLRGGRPGFLRRQGRRGVVELVVSGG